ncbi:MAG: DUF2516 family protein [Bifidobacteriaceae bacterium]|jgi:hypothetical protein|nr:DUF2516 family protein [Bifidobacteriaceae bacterium]
MAENLQAAQMAVVTVLVVGCFAVELWAVISGALAPARAYVAAGRMPKPAWMALLIAATAVGFASLPPGYLLLRWGWIPPMIAVTVALVYLLMVRPQVKRPRRRRGPKSRPPSW